MKTIRFREYDDDASTSSVSSSSLSSSLSSSPSSSSPSPTNGTSQFRECILPLPPPSPKVKNDSSNSNSNTNSENNTNDTNAQEGQAVILSWTTIGGDNNRIIDVNRKLRLNNIDLSTLLMMMNTWNQKVKTFFKDLLLPVGYPHSVNEGYIQYQFYDSLQGLCSYLRGVVSTTAVLTAAGVGDAEATALSAAMHWATKDGCGMIGGLLFSYYSSSYFDSHVKEFRLFADIMFDTGLTLDMIAPYVPRRYLIFISIASTLCRTLCGITAGATKGSISQHFAKHNMADLNAKEGTQETLVSLVGMVFGIFIARMIQNMEKQCKILEGSSIYSYSAIVATWYIFIALTATHLWANYVGVKAVRLRSLNRQRAEVVLHDVIQKGVKLVKEDMYKVKSDTIAMKMKLVQFNEEVVIPRPSECNESLLHSVEKMIFRGKVSLGTKLSDCFNNMTRDEILSIVGHLFRNEKYLLVISPSDISESLKVNVVLRLGASEDDQLKAFIHAMILKDSMNEKVLKNKKSRTQLIARSKNCVDLLFSTKTVTMDKLVEKGWEKKLLLGFSQSRAAWNDVKIERSENMS